VTKTTPISLTIAGSDSGGGAGIQADIKAMSANGVYAASVITAVTAQNTRSVSAVHEIPAPIVAAQIDAVLSDLSVQSIKLGMLFSPQIIQAVSSARFGGPSWLIR
jgi:hydroxymethylpyrimidine/phosphomethylpyrimidine kinase